MNSIVWNNTPAQLAVDQAGQVIASHSNIQGGYVGAGNLNADPLLTTGVLPWRLRPLSPCIDAGTGANPLPASDFEGDARVIGGGVDIGADEYPTPSAASALMSRPSLIGGMQHLVVQSTSPFAPLYVLLDIATGTVPLGPWGATQIALSPAVVPLAAPSPVFGPSLTYPFSDAFGSWSLTTSIPNLPPLMGVSFFIEGFVLDFLAPNGLFRQTNMLTMTFE